MKYSSFSCKYLWEVVPTEWRRMPPPAEYILICYPLQCPHIIGGLAPSRGVGSIICKTVFFLASMDPTYEQHLRFYHAYDAIAKDKETPYLKEAIVHLAHPISQAFRKASKAATKVTSGEAFSAYCHSSDRHCFVSIMYLWARRQKTGETCWDLPLTSIVMRGIKSTWSF